MYIMHIVVVMSIVVVVVVVMQIISSGTRPTTRQEEDEDTSTIIAQVRSNEVAPAPVLLRTEIEKIFRETFEATRNLLRSEFKEKIEASMNANELLRQQIATLMATIASNS